MEFRDPFAQSTQAYGQAGAVARDEGLRSYMLRIYNYMASALALTGITAMFAANSPAVLSALYNVQDGHAVGMSGLGWLVLLAPLGLVMWLGMGLNRMSTTTAQAIYWGYSVLMGLSLSSIFLLYTGESIARTFFVTAGTFGAMSLYGYTTKRDLTAMGSFLMMGLIGLIVASVVNMFLHSSGLNFAVSVIGVGIFVGLTAWDTQKLKGLYYMYGGDDSYQAGDVGRSLAAPFRGTLTGGDMLGKVTIMGALTLYMDFINIFIYLLRFMGDRR